MGTARSEAGAGPADQGGVFGIGSPGRLRETTLRPCICFESSRVFPTFWPLLPP